MKRLNMFKPSQIFAEIPVKICTTVKRKTQRARMLTIIMRKEINKCGSYFDY